MCFSPRPRVPGATFVWGEARVWRQVHVYGSLKRRVSEMHANNPQPMEPIAVRIPEAIRLTGMSRSRLYDLMGSGEIEFVKVGASTLVLVASLRQFVESRRTTRLDDMPKS